MSNTKTSRDGWERFVAMLNRLILVNAVEAKWLARDVGISDSTLSRYLNGQTEPDVSIAFEICRSIGGDYGKQLLQALCGDEFEVETTAKLPITFLDINSNNVFDTEDKLLHTARASGCVARFGEEQIRAQKDGKICPDERAKLDSIRAEAEMHLTAAAL